MELNEEDLKSEFSEGELDKVEGYNPDLYADIKEDQRVLLKKRTCSRCGRSILSNYDKVN